MILPEILRQQIILKQKSVLLSRNSGELRVLINTVADTKLKNLTSELVKNLPNTSVVNKTVTDKFNEITLSKISDASADAVAEINEIVSTMRAKGVEITRAVCNSSVIEDLKKNTAIKNQIYVLAGGAISSISSAKVLEFLKQETGVTFYAYDNVYVNEEGKAVKYVADDTIVFLPEGTLGQTHMGVTPEESDLQALGTANVSVIENGIAVATYGTEDPVNVEMKVSMVGMPSFERADEVYILDTAA